MYSLISPYLRTCGYSQVGLEGFKGSDLLYLSLTCSFDKEVVSQPSFNKKKEHFRIELFAFFLTNSFLRTGEKQAFICLGFFFPKLSKKPLCFEDARFSLKKEA